MAVTTFPTQAAAADVRVRAMHQCDIVLVARMHREEFPANVVARFGMALLRGYYRSFVASPHAVAYVAERDGEMVGYLVGIVRLREHRRRLLRRHLHRIGPVALLGALTRPALAIALIKARLARRRASARGAETADDHRAKSAVDDGQHVRARDPEPPQAVAVLSHVAVSAVHRGHGLGNALVGQFELEAASCGVGRLCLATTDDSGAAGFYERRGWRIAGRRDTFDGRPISIYELDLPSRRTPPCTDPAQ